MGMNTVSVVMIRLKSSLDLESHLFIQTFKPGWPLIYSTSQLFTLENFSSLYEVALSVVISQKIWELKIK